jgi:hypothetical protein
VRALSPTEPPHGPEVPRARGPPAPWAVRSPWGVGRRGYSPIARHLRDCRARQGPEASPQTNHSGAGDTLTAAGAAGRTGRW